MKKMSKKNLFYIGFFIVLIISFYWVLTALIPDLNKRRIPPISYVRPFSFTDQYGQPFTNKDVAGKVYVAEYFYTTCPGICKTMNNHMRVVFEKFKNEKEFLILSHTSDPETDSPSQLKRYADSMGVSSANWIFLTGRKDSLYSAARISYTIDDPANNLQDIRDQFIHTQKWALVNKEGKVTGIYDGLKLSEIDDMIADIKKLIKE
jgi:protein SCO1/2